MDKKRPSQQLPEDLKGFEEFIEGQGDDSNFLPKQPKKEVSFEHFTFLTNDSMRLTKLKDLLMEKVPFASRFEQGEKLMIEQNKEIELLKNRLFDQCQKIDSSYRQSLTEIFDAFFSPPKD